MSGKTVTFASPELTHLKSILKSRSEPGPSTSANTVSLSALTDQELQERIRVLELEEELKRVKWQREEEESRVAADARSAQEAAEAAHARARRRYLAVALALGVLLALLLAAVVVAGAVTQYVPKVRSGKLFGLALLVSIAVYLLAIGWTLWSVLDGILLPQS